MSLPHYPACAVSDELLDRLCATANQAADAAAKVTMQHFRKVISVDNKDTAGGFDPVTIADKGAEVAIRNTVLAEFPEHGFFGEETEAVQYADGLLWVVDPIDGTRAFITGLPLWGTLIAVYNGADVIFGLLDQPYLKERFVGRLGRAELHSPNGVSVLQARKNVHLRDAIVQTTAPGLFISEYEQRAFQKVSSAASMTRFGGDCYCYALLAMGFVDVVIESDLKPYDIQALIPIVEGAGGVISDWQGGSAAAGGSVVACGSKALHAEVLTMLAETR